MTLGKVYLVGAGPGDPRLITLRGVECLRQADVVLVDHLAAPELLAHARPGAEVIDAGKESGRQTRSQAEINELLAARARAGLQVVRLKGGDPYVFGRGGEEAHYLHARGVPFEVVPGVSAALAAPAAAGIPLTHRGLSSSVLITTGHEDATKGSSAVRWPELARSADTLVVLMCVERLGSIVAELLAAGRSPTEPAALVRWGSTPEQEVVVGPLGELAERARARRIRPPATLVVGRVVELRAELGWLERLPLFGRRILLAPARREAGPLAARLRELGAQPLAVPAPGGQAAPTAEPRAWLGRLPTERPLDAVVLASAPAVGRLLVALDGQADLLPASAVVCGGPAAAAAARAAGLRVAAVAQSSRTEGLVAVLVRLLAERLLPADGQAPTPAPASPRAVPREP